ncbi:Domain of unknown function DUF559 [uncultured Caudovirales phage]|uniref:DUF559 domain-containing protein n=1 Tax=uncultured Caudovirales phage TaxID=2100421 RepID=A0A6J7WHI5_9CAUD|nr:Domain of unknown function DUF559 [uncultured Caudovirales phage]
MVGAQRLEITLLVAYRINNYMTNKTSLLCSCIVCKKEKSSKGIFTHYMIAHTIEGKEKHKLKQKNAVQKATEYWNNEKDSNIQQYNKNPSMCQHCESTLPYEVRHNKFCSHSCAAIITNSTVDRSKFRTGPKKGFVPKNYAPYTKIKQCVICNKFHPKSGQTCSPECHHTLLSDKMIERIKSNKRSNYRRDKKSYLERSFEDWLVKNNISLRYEDEYTIKNHITKKWYFVDFYFPEINLIVELDGKQHEKPKHKEQDRIRDEYITTHLGIQIFRISHTEYQLGSKIDELKSRLVPPLGQ